MSDTPDDQGGYVTIRGERFDMPKELTGREFRYVKLETGLRGGEIDEALAMGDSDALLAMCVVAMRRAGKDADMDDLLDMGLGTDEGIQFFTEDETARPTEAAAAAPKPKRPGAAKSGRQTTPASTD